MATHNIDIKLGTKYDGSGANKAKADVNDIKKSISIFSSEVSGPLGRLKELAGGILTGGIWQMGAAAITMAFEYIGNKAKEAADKVAAATKRMAEAMHEKFIEAKSAELDKLASSAANATTKADAASKAYGNLANAVGKVASAVAAAEKAQGREGLAKLAAEKEKAVGGAANKDEADRIAADYDIKIAKARADAVRRENAANAEASRRGVEDAKKQLDIAKARVVEASKARAEAKKAADQYKNGPDKDLEKSSAKALAETEKKVTDARQLLKTAKADYAAAIAKSQQTDAEGGAAATDADTALERAKRARRELAEAQARAEKEASEKAAAERARLDAQEAARRERERQKELADKIRDHQKLLAEEQKSASAAQSRVAAATAKEQQAWNWYRDKDSLKAQLDEEKANAEAEKQFEKDFEKLRWKHRDWREAKDLSLDEEAVRRVGLAREERENAEKHLAEIEKNTADLAQKLDELLQVKG